MHSPAGVTRGGTGDRGLVLRLLRLLPVRAVIYSCGVADAAGRSARPAAGTGRKG